MAKFCNICGTPLDENATKCSNCNKTISQNTQGTNNNVPSDVSEQKNEPSRKGKTNNFFKKNIVIISLLSFIMIALVIMGLTKNPITINSDSTETSNEITPPDADEYFSNNSTVLKEYDANESANVSTEVEVHESLTSRGFTQAAIMYEYSMDGKYTEAAEISTSSSAKHPMYQTYYVTQNEEIWSIFSINGVVMANPVSYNMTSSRDVQVVISESDTITSYDSTKNKFYETIPNDTALIVIKVDEINSETLDKLTVKEIDNYD